MAALGVLFPDDPPVVLFPFLLIGSLFAYGALIGTFYVFFRALICPGGIRSRPQGAVVGFVAGTVASAALFEGTPIFMWCAGGVVFAFMGMAEVVRVPPELGEA